MKFLAMFRVLSMLMVVSLMTLALSGCASTSRTGIVTTFYPLYDFTKHVAQDVQDVSMIIPAGVEVHGYEPSPGDIESTARASVLVGIGIEFEEFEHRLLNANPGLRFIDAASGIELLEHDDGDGLSADAHTEDANMADEDSVLVDEHDEMDGDDMDDDGHDMDGDSHDEGVDTHVWLSPKNAMVMVQNIRDGLSSLDQSNAETYAQNAQMLLDRLVALDDKYTSQLSDCGKDTILVSHNAFSYLAKDYGLKLLSVSGLEPEAEPTPLQLASLVQEAREHDLKVVFYEELAGDRVAKTIAAEIGAEVLLLNALPSVGDAEMTYVQFMEENLQSLRAGLECIDR